MTWEQLLELIKSIDSDEGIAKTLGVSVQDIEDEEKLAHLTMKFVYETGYAKGKQDAGSN